MTAFTSALPRNSSRTSTHAVIVPRTALISETTREAPSVSFSAATACGLETASQNPDVPSFDDSQPSAASGSTTRTLRNVVTMPRDSAVPAPSLDSRAGRATATLASDATYLSLDPGHDPLVRIEEGLLHLRPAAEAELVDRELPRPRRELLLVGLEDALDDRAVPVVGEDLLRRRRLEEADEPVRLVLVVARLRHRDRVLDQDRRARDHVRHVLPGALRCDRLVLVGEEHVALAGQERVQRVAGA